MMGLAVVTVASGGLPVVDVTAIAPRTGTPVTEAANGRGVPVTKVAALGMPVVFETIGVGGGAPVFPIEVTGLIGQWDMSAPANYTINGTQVVSMADLSGAGNTLGDASTFQKPTYSATGLNSRPTMLCDGSLTHIDKTAFPLGSGNTLTVFGVAILTTACANFGRLIGYGAPTRNDNNFIGSFNFSRNATNATMWLERNSVTTTPLSAGYTTPHRFIATINSSGVMTVYVDGVASSTATSSGNWTTGGLLSVGGSVGGTPAKWASAISEIGIATGYSNAAAVAALDTYLKNKWGL